MAKSIDPSPRPFPTNAPPFESMYPWFGSSTVPLQWDRSQWADGIQVNGDGPADRGSILGALDMLSATADGRPVVKFLSDNHVKITVVNTEKFKKDHPGTGAVHDGLSGEIIIPRDAFSGRNGLGGAALVLAHEGQHAIDADRQGHVRGGSPASFTQHLGAAIFAIGRQNPFSAYADATRRDMTETEVRAYRRQYRASIEMGVSDDNGVDVTNLYPHYSDMPDDLNILVVSDAQIRQWVYRNGLYSTDPLNRFIDGSPLVLAAAATGAVGGAIGGGIVGLTKHTALFKGKTIAFSALAAAGAMLVAAGVDMFVYAAKKPKQV